MSASTNIARVGIERKKIIALLVIFIVFLLGSLVFSGISMYQIRGQELSDNTRELISEMLNQHVEPLALELFVPRTGAYKKRFREIKRDLQRLSSRSRLCFLDASYKPLMSEIDGCGDVVKKMVFETNSALQDKRLRTMVLKSIGEGENRAGFVLAEFSNPISLASVVGRYRVLLASFFTVFLLVVFMMGFAFRKAINQIFKFVVKSERQAAIGEAAQLIAHDIRRPLNVGLMSLASLNPKDPEDARFFSAAKEKFRKSTEEVEALLKDIMCYGSADTKGSEKIDISELIEELQKNALSQKKKGVEVKVKLGHTRDILGNRDHIKRALQNVLDNALEACPEGGMIWIKTRDKKVGVLRRDYIEIRIGNSGSVISSQDIKRIFEPYYSKGKRGGTGLGLAIAKKFVEEHGGKVFCCSAKTMGTEFICFLTSTATTSK